MRTELCGYGTSRTRTRIYRWRLSTSGMRSRSSSKSFEGRKREQTRSGTTSVSIPSSPANHGWQLMYSRRRRSLKSSKLSMFSFSPSLRSPNSALYYHLLLLPRRPRLAVQTRNHHLRQTLLMGGPPIPVPGLGGSNRLPKKSKCRPG